MGAVYENRIVYVIDYVSNLRRRARSYFLNFLHSMILVSRIYTLRGITGKEVGIKPKSGYALYHWKTFLFRYTRIYSRLIYHYVTF